MNLPQDLTDFLGRGGQLQYDPDTCEAGAVTLLPLSDLEPQRFPVETSGMSFHSQDPHYPEVNSYLVLGVNLVAECDDEYDPEGLLLWLPVEGRYGIWDSSHCRMLVFGPDVTWDKIVAKPAAHLNAGWRGADPESPPTEYLVPFPAHPYADGQVYEPQPA